MVFFYSFGGCRVNITFICFGLSFLPVLHIQINQSFSWINPMWIHFRTESTRNCRTSLILKWWKQGNCWWNGGFKKEEAVWVPKGIDYPLIKIYRPCRPVNMLYVCITCLNSIYVSMKPWQSGRVPRCVWNGKLDYIKGEPSSCCDVILQRVNTHTAPSERHLMIL